MRMKGRLWGAGSGIINMCEMQARVRGEKAIVGWPFGLPKWNKAVEQQRGGRDGMAWKRHSQPGQCW
jgi:hypothetical protein